MILLEPGFDFNIVIRFPSFVNPEIKDKFCENIVYPILDQLDLPRIITWVDTGELVLDIDSRQSILEINVTPNNITHLTGSDDLPQLPDGSDEQ